MPATFTLYNHTRARFASGANAVGDTYKVKLLTAATFNATHTTLAATGGTEVAASFGYTAGGPTVANPTVSIVNTNGAKFDADDVRITATGGTISASCGILYNATDADSPPVAFIDFGGTESAGAGTDFLIAWDANGIVTFG